jgi:hypothetical protein
MQNVTKTILICLMTIILLSVAIPLKNQLAYTYVSAEQIPEQNTYLTSLPVTEVSEEEAYTVAQNWLALIVHHKGHWAASTNPEITEMHELTKDNRLLGRFFIIHPRGFLFIPSIKEFAPIKSYSRFNTINLHHEDGWVELITDSMENNFISIEKWIQDNPEGDINTLFDIDYTTCWEELNTDPSDFHLHLQNNKSGLSYYQTGEVLLSSAWHQSPPYNDQCPDTSCSYPPCFPNTNAVVGCVATAGAQTMRHWNWPPYGEGGSPYADTYDWVNMLDWLEYDIIDCDPLPQTQVDAIAELCAEVGEAVDMTYGCSPPGSSASTSALVDAYEDHYRYSTNCYYRWRSGYTTTEWYNKLKGEFFTYRPVTYRIGNDTSGHAFVTDGWEEISTIKYVHINYGWGYYNRIGWYDIDNIPGGYPTNWEYAIFNIYPAQAIDSQPSGNYTKQSSFPYRYFVRDTTGKAASFSSGQYLQTLPDIIIKGVTDNGMTIHGSTSDNTRLYTNGDTSKGIIIKDGSIKLSNNGGLCLTPLNYPRYLISTHSNSSTVWIEWEDAIGDQDGFQIWRKEGSGSYTLLDTTTNTYYHDNSVHSGAYYLYKVRAYTTEGPYSDYSNEVIVVIPIL